jgi:hypothetical protein
VSLGTSKRNKHSVTSILGQEFSIERIGTDGDKKAFARSFRELDGKVSALGVGGADLYVVIDDRRYEFKEIRRLVSGARTTPVVDGSGLKHTLERNAIETLQQNGVIDFSKERVLLVSAVDRFGMAQALDKAGADIVYGDLLFGLGLPVRLNKYQQVRTLGRLVLPLITRLPLEWFYPTGEKQEKRTPKFGKVFDWATVIAGDWHFIRRFAPDRLVGKTVLTQTIRTADLEWLGSIGVNRLITTTPVIGGETFATNVMEGVLVSLMEKKPENISEAEMLSKLSELGWKPNVVEGLGVVQR